MGGQRQASAKRIKKLLVLQYDPLGFFWLDMAAAVSRFEHSTQQQDITSRKHVHKAISTAECHVIHSRIGRQVHQLAFGGNEVGITEQFSSAQARAVEDD